MRDLIKRSGIILIVAGVMLISYYEIKNIVNNELLIISGGLIFLGFLLYVILNNVME